MLSKKINQLFLFFTVLLPVLAACQQTKIRGSDKQLKPQPAEAESADIYGQAEIQLISVRQAQDQSIKGQFRFKIFSPTDFTVTTKTDLKLEFSGTDSEIPETVAKVAPVEYIEVNKPSYCDFIFNIKYPGKVGPKGEPYDYDLGMRVFLCPTGKSGRDLCNEEEKAEAKAQKSINCGVFSRG